MTCYNPRLLYALSQGLILMLMTACFAPLPWPPPTTDLPPTLDIARGNPIVEVRNYEVFISPPVSPTATAASKDRAATIHTILLLGLDKELSQLRVKVDGLALSSLDTVRQVEVGAPSLLYFAPAVYRIEFILGPAYPRFTQWISLPQYTHTGYRYGVIPTSATFRLTLDGQLAKTVRLKPAFHYYLVSREPLSIIPDPTRIGAFMYKEEGTTEICLLENRRPSTRGGVCVASWTVEFHIKGPCQGTFVDCLSSH
jgi:hypothetical protein